MKELNERIPETNRQEYLALLMKCRDSMLEAVRLTGDNLKLNQDIMKLESEVERLQNILDYIIDSKSRGHWAPGYRA